MCNFLENLYIKGPHVQRFFILYIYQKSKYWDHFTTDSSPLGPQVQLHLSGSIKISYI